MLSLVARLFLCYFTNNWQSKRGGHTILTYNTNRVSGPSEIKMLIEQSLDADKALDIKTISLDEQSGLADYMIIASGTSSRHVSAMADKLKERLHARGVKEVNVEGQAQSDWVIIDAGDVIIHLFRPEVREFYNIERMWGNFQPYNVVSSNQVSA